jgi:hypothetical protein
MQELRQLSGSASLHCDLEDHEATAEGLVSWPLQSRLPTCFSRSDGVPRSRIALEHAGGITFDMEITEKQLDIGRLDEFEQDKEVKIAQATAIALKAEISDLVGPLDRLRRGEGTEAEKAAWKEYQER